MLQLARTSGSATSGRTDIATRDRASFIRSERVARPRLIPRVAPPSPRDILLIVQRRERLLVVRELASEPAPAQAGARRAARQPEPHAAARACVARATAHAMSATSQERVHERVSQRVGRPSAESRVGSADLPDNRPALY